MRTRRLTGVCLVLCLILAAGCSSRRGQVVATGSWSSIGESATTVADTLSFAERLADYETLPDSVRAERHAEAERAAGDWREFELEAEQHYDRVYRGWWYTNVPAGRLYHYGVGLGNSVVDLREAVDIDPAFAEAWGGLGRLCIEAGDLTSGLDYLERARLAARVQREAGRPLPPAEELDIHRNLAWALRDLARWEEGLAAVASGRELDPGDQVLTVIEGLLLAGAGRFSEAMSVAVRLEPLRYRQFDFTYFGFKYQESSYANNWIRAQAYLAAGDFETAYDLLGEVDLYAYRGRLPLADRYWRDVGLLAELNGDPQAPVWYAVGHISRHYLGFFPLASQNVAPQVLDLPDPRMPCYTSFGGRFYAGGSPLSYVALQMNLLAMSTFPQQSEQAAGRALQRLEILERCGVRPDYCRALRGRIYYLNEDFTLARTELTAARELIAARGEVDPKTSTMLGLIAMREERWRDARDMLAEAVAADSGNAAVWRSLGVAQAKLGERAAAGASFTSAVDLEPANVAGYYNRGLYHLQSRSFGLAAADLETALRLDPENREVQRLLQMAVTGARESGQIVSVQRGPPPGFEPAPDAVLAELEAELETLFTLPDSLRAEDAQATLRIRELERAYAADGDPSLRLVLALAYLDHGRYEEVQLLLGPGWQMDLQPEEELMLLYADRQLGERRRAEDLARSLVAGEAGEGNPYLWALTAQIIRNDPRAGRSGVLQTYLKYSEGTKARSYGFPPLDGMTRWMKDGFDSAREYRRSRGLPVGDVETTHWERGMMTVNKGGPKATPDSYDK